MSNQPIWKFEFNAGDVNPIEHGGYFIFTDATGVYDPEAELLTRLNDYGDGKGWWEVRRFTLTKCSFVGGILSDNQFHPDHAAWFAKPESEKATRPQDTTYLSFVADCTGITVEELIQFLTSDDLAKRAEAYRQIGDVHGWDNFDSYPLTLTRDEVEARYKDII